MLQSLPAASAPGLDILESGPHCSGATYRETVRDLRVKVLGGSADLTREWREGRRWFHPYWADLQFEYLSNNSDGEPDRITRYDLSYDRKTGPSVPINSNLEEVHPVDLRDPNEIQEFVHHFWYRYPDTVGGCLRMIGHKGSLSCS